MPSSVMGSWRRYMAEKHGMNDFSTESETARYTYFRVKSLIFAEVLFWLCLITSAMQDAHSW